MASAQPKQGSDVTVFIMQKMDCPTEERLIRNKLEPMPGIEDLRFDLMQRELTVRHSLIDARPIETALTQLGMEPKRKVPGGEVSAEQPETISRLTQLLVAVSGIAAFGAEIVSWTISEQSLFVIGLSVIAILTGGAQTARKGLIAIRTLTLNINFLMTVAVAGALVIGEWPEAAMVTFLFALAELIEAYSLDRARHAVRDLMEMTPETALVRQDDSNFAEMPAANVVVGAFVRVKPGARIPLDGTVIGGNSTVNQAPITGESMPVAKTSGDSVFAGTINERGVLEMRVTANKGNTTLARIVRSVQAAQAERAPTQRFVDQFARYYTPAIVLLAVLIAAVPPLVFGAQFMPWFYKALVTLVIACPCALVISTPVTVVSGLAAAARRGILIKGGVYLEEGHKLKALALDKTGTLTRGKPEVTDIEPLNEVAPEHYLKLAAALDAYSDHPVASAVIRRWQGVSGDRCLPAVTDFESITGRGAKGRIDGALHYIGNHRLVEELGICGSLLEAALERLEQQGKTVIVLMDELQPLCIFAVADTVRDTSIQAVSELQTLGVHCVMLTGDNVTTAKAIGAQVGIDDVRGNLLPEDKLAAIDDLRQRYGVVGMVGDGVNDAPALAKSSIGFAMGAAGTDTALETADVALMQDDLRRIPLFVALSRKTGNVLKQNITLAIGIKVIFLALNVAGLATLWMAVFADLGASLIVVFNGLRILKFRT
jgi:Cd2+/Zn2+-exporting ATPase